MRTPDWVRRRRRYGERDRIPGLGVENVVNQKRAGVEG